jgi:hypothetical protein
MVSRRTKSQPRASAVRRRRRGIDAHQRCRKEEQLRAASRSATNVFDGERTRNESDETSTKGCKQFKCTWKTQWLMRRKRWASKNQDETRCHCAPFAWITRASLFCVTGAKRGKGFCRNGPGLSPTDRGPASAGARADDPLRPPSLTLSSDSEVALRLAGSCWASVSL